VLKECTTSDKVIKFLSKVTARDSLNQFVLTRQVNRIAATGSATNTGLTAVELDTSVADQLSAYLHHDDPIHAWAADTF
jgi:hypothetical protein